MHESGCMRGVILQVGMAQHAQLLQEDGTLAPETALGDGIAAIVQRNRVLHASAQGGHVFISQHAAPVLPASIANLFLAVDGYVYFIFISYVSVTHDRV